MMKRLLRTCALLAAVCAISTTHAQAPAPVKIGFMAVFSGPFATIGQDQYDAFMLAVEQGGGKLGGVPVEILKEDSQGKPDVGTQIVQKLIEREHVPIITGITSSAVTMAVARRIAEKEVFMISTNSGPSPLAGAQCSPYQFVVSWQGDNIAEVVGQYANDKGIKNVYLLGPNYQGGKDVMAGFKRLYKGNVVDEVYTPLDQLDFSAELTQLSAKKPDAVFAFYPGALAVSFMRQYEQAGLKGKVPLLTTGIIDGTSLPALGESATGVVAGAFWGPDFDNPQNKRFVDTFEKKYGRIPSNFAAQAYDGANLIASALAKTKGNVSDKKAFAAALHGADFKSVRGKFKFNNNNFPIIDMHMFEAVKDAKGRMSLKTIATPLKDHQDAYHSQCPIK